MGRVLYAVGSDGAAGSSGRCRSLRWGWAKELAGAAEGALSTSGALDEVVVNWIAARIRSHRRMARLRLRPRRLTGRWRLTNPPQASSWSASLCAIAAYERHLMREKVAEARASSVAHGRRTGPKAILLPAQAQMARAAMGSGQSPLS